MPTDMVIIIIIIIIIHTFLYCHKVVTSEAVVWRRCSVKQMRRTLAISS